MVQKACLPDRQASFFHECNFTQTPFNFVIEYYPTAVERGFIFADCFLDNLKLTIYHIEPFYMSKYFSICIFITLFSCSIKEQKMFTKLSATRTGIKFKNIIKDSEELNVLNYAYWYNGGGVAVGDVNNDGLPDIYFTGNLVNSRLYLNKGNLRFKEIAKKAGVLAGGLWNTGTCMVDVDGDGYLDIYVCRSAAKDPEKRRNLLFINNGDLTFTEKAKAFGLDDSSYSTHAAFFDYDRDGDLDVYILNHSLDKYASFNEQLNALKKTESKAFADKLFRNDGGKFVDVSKDAGLINNVLGFGLGLAVLDVNNDHWPDMYISNDYNEEDYLYINQRDGTFKETIRESMGHVSLSSMGNESGDFNNDLRPDIISLDMLPEEHYELKMSRGPEHFEKYNKLIKSGFHYQTIRNMLQLNNGNGTFSDIGELAGVSRTDWSWSPLLADYDNDGWKDLFISNGYGKNYLNMDVIGYVVEEKLMAQRENRALVPLDILAGIPDLMSTNYMYKNNRDLTFSNVSSDWGFEGQTLSNGAAYADLDNDGDLDLIINNINEYAQIYRNNSESLTSNNYIKIQLKGMGGNTYGIGSKVIVKTAGDSQYMELMPSRGFQSSVNPELIFGLGHHTVIDTITVYWPDSTFQTLSEVPANQLLILHQSKANKPTELNKNVKPVFVKIEMNLGVSFNHHEPDYIDFKVDKLIPRGLSGSGPGVAIGDVNQDGLDDLYIGGAHGQSGVLYLQQADGNFSELVTKSFENDKACEDTDAVFFDADGDGYLDLFVTSGGLEQTDKSVLQDRIYLNSGNGHFIKSVNALPDLKTNNACVTFADIDDDGDEDLFVGARFIPGNYPMAPPSYLLLNNGAGKFENRTSKICKDLMSGGMVSDAVFTDINNDNKPDLIVVGEWMKIEIYLNIDGVLVEQVNNGLENTHGWWNTINASDYDGDGDIDLIAGNMGMNNPFKATTSEPVRLYYSDFDNDGNVDPILTYYINGKSSLAYSLDEFVAQIKTLKSKFPTYDSFAKLNEEDIIDKLNLYDGDSLIATTFHSSFFRNNGMGGFDIIPLPVEAQFSPVYSIHSMDVNGDNVLDIILGGNQSNTRVSTGRFDALYGLVLTGNGDGHFTSMDPVSSGIKVKGDIRSITQFDNRFGTYLLFTLNNGTPRVYKKHP